MKDFPVSHHIAQDSLHETIMQMYRDHESVPLLRAKRPVGFDDRGVDIEQFIYQICMLSCMQKLGVGDFTFKAIICNGCGKHGVKRPLSLRRLWKNETRVSGSAYFDRCTPHRPGKINIGIGGHAHPAIVREVILHEFIHSIGYDHGRKMNLLLAQAALELWGVNLHEIVSSDKFDTRYGVDNALTKWLKENVYTENHTLTHTPIKTKKSKIRIEDNEISICMSKNAYQAMAKFADYLADIDWEDDDEFPLWVTEFTRGECLEIEGCEYWVTMSRDQWESFHEEFRYRFEMDYDDEFTKMLRRFRTVDIMYVQHCR